MVEMIQDKPFLVAILAGACAQLIKVISFLLLEKKVNYRRFVQTDGAPNMHSAAFSALAISVGMKDGFGSVSFAIAVCFTSIILVDTLNVKNATSRHAEAIVLLLDRLRKHEPGEGKPGLSYTPLDVFTGIGLGVAFAFAVL